MSNYYKKLILLLLFIGSISSIVVYFTMDIEAMYQLNVFRPWSIMLAVIFLTLGMYFDGTRLVKLAEIAGEYLSFFQALRVVCSNYFGALLTPGATGGAVAQVLFLRYAGVSTGKATVLVLVRTILSILFLIVSLPFVVYIEPALVPWLSPHAMAIAAVALATLSIGGMLLIRTSCVRRSLLFLVGRFSLSMRRRVWRMYRDMQAAVNMLSSAPIGMIKVFIDTGLSLLALYSIVPALFMGLDIPINWPVVLGRMIFLNLLLYFAPTPGGIGIAEGGFVFLFSDFVPAGTVGVLAVVWRIFAEYLPFVVGLYVSTKAFGTKLLKLSK